jgi:YVTN family beta-propeller protein
MNLRRVGWLAVVALATLLWMSCGDIYRPVVIPTTLTPPNPANFHAVFGINGNVAYNSGATFYYHGTALQIDVSGDSNIGEATMGVNPTHAAILPDNSRVFVASADSLDQVDPDAIVSFTPATDSSIATGLGTPQRITLPSGSLPVFVATSQKSAVYVANYGTNSVSALNTSTNVVSMTGAVGVNPVALVETPDALNLYVVNQGSNTVTDLSPKDLSTLATIPVGSTPVWAVARLDGRRLYVIAQGDGQLYTINTATNAVMSNQSVGGLGANFVLYDESRNRLYVTNPNAGAVYVFSASSDPPTPLGTVAIPAPPISASATNCATYTCTYSPVAPVSVAALPDGSRFYVASYVTGTATSTGNPATCPDPTVTAPGCVIPQVTVFDAGSLALKTMVFPLIPAASAPSASGFAVAPAPFCAPVAPYTPANARFRMSAAAAVDSSRVYASMCDGGWVAIVNTTTNTIATGQNNSTDTLVTDLPTPFSAAAPGANGEPPLQNPVFLLTGQ